MKLQAILVSLLAATVALAGCTDGDPEEVTVAGADGLVDTDNFNLGNKGAINGLLVDDNFRPIQLKQDWGSAEPGDFQDVGFILVLETAQEIETTENGEFQILPLDPGTYTLRVSAAAHEAIDTEVKVEKGEFTDVNVLSRRTSSVNNQIITQEFAAFVDCWIPVWTELNCFADMSLDSKRAGFKTDFRALEGEVGLIVSEFQYDQPGDYDGSIGFCHGESFESWGMEVQTRGSDYGRLVVASDEATFDKWKDHEDLNLAGTLRGLHFCTTMWPQGEVLPGLVGFGTSVEARIMQSAFIGEPQIDPAEYCVICEDESQRPEIPE